MNFSTNSKVNHKSGFKLLTHFQDEWQKLHKNSEICSKKAQTAMQKLNKVELSSSKLLTSIQLLLVGYQSLSQIDERVQGIQNELDGLFGYFDKIETILTILRNDHEEQDLEEFKLKLDEDTSWSIKGKMIDSQVKKELINNEHKKRVLEFELKHEQELEERRKLYEKAFEEEKRKYLEAIKDSSN